MATNDPGDFKSEGMMVEMPELITNQVIAEFAERTGPANIQGIIMSLTSRSDQWFGGLSRDIRGGGGQEGGSLYPGGRGVQPPHFQPHIQKHP